MSTRTDPWPAGTPCWVDLSVPDLQSAVDFYADVIGWTFVVGAFFPLARAFRPGSVAVRTGLALVFVVTSVFLFSDRDVAPIFGHLSPLAGAPHR